MNSSNPSDHLASPLPTSQPNHPRMRLGAGLLLAAVMVLSAGCSYTYSSFGRRAVRADFQRPVTTAHPAGNPYSPEKAELGRLLFLEKKLSGDGTISCATCHDPERDFQDGLKFAVGIAEPAPTAAQRRTPTLWNVGEHRKFFWDGRSPSLEDQALKPIANPAEMGSSGAAAAGRLAEDATWREAFAAAFPEDPRVSPENIAWALATYQRTLVSPEAPFDRWVAGDETALDEAALRGFGLFTGKANCATCHTGWAFTDGKLHDIGLAVAPQDGGRSKFKTPTLRELSGRAPFMHDGSLASVEAVVRHYATGGERRFGVPAPVVLSEREQSDLVAFLRSLDSGDVARAEGERM